MSAIDQLAIHFAMDSNLLHKESDEARRQLDKLEGGGEEERGRKRGGGGRRKRRRGRGRGQEGGKEGGRRERVRRRGGSESERESWLLALAKCEY